MFELEIEKEKSRKKKTQILNPTQTHNQNPTQQQPNPALSYSRRGPIRAPRPAPTPHPLRPSSAAPAQRPLAQRPARPSAQHSLPRDSELPRLTQPGAPAFRRPRTGRPARAPRLTRCQAGPTGRFFSPAQRSPRNGRALRPQISAGLPSGHALPGSPPAII